MSTDGPLARLAHLARFGVRLDLTRMQRALARLGRPQERLAVVHLAGTNGKGSTAAMIAACLRAAGHRTGLYTSPHLCRFGERIQVDGEEIDLATLGRWLERALAAEPELTFFEAATAVALCHFAEREVEIAVLETGLGGRLDATNVVTPRLCILTRIDLDHLEVLGPDLVSVAREKVGIVKPGVPVVAAAAPAEVEAVLRQRCAAVGAPLLLDRRDFQLAPGESGLAYRGPRLELEGLTLGLAGPHQIENAALALAGLELLAGQGWSLSPAALRQGLAGVRWPGRMERIGQHLLDGAHNPSGARALAGALDAGVEHCLVMGLLGPRDPWPVLEPLLRLAGRVVFTRPRSPRAIPPEELAALTAGAAVAADLPRALDLLRGDPRPRLVTGSLYLVGEARALLLGEPVDPVRTADPLGRP